MSSLFEEFIELVSSDFAIGAIVGIVIITIGLAFYGAKRMEEN